MSAPLLLASAAAGAEIPPLLIVPFGLLLLLIATMPLTPPRLKHVWEHYYPHIAIGLGVLVAAYYLWRIPEGGEAIVHTMTEYFSFIALIGSLFVVAGGASAQTSHERPVTFTCDIAPILQRSCQHCHRPDSIAPMSLLTYEQTRPYARAIKLRTSQAYVLGSRGVMPPWFI